MSRSSAVSATTSILWNPLPMEPRANQQFPPPETIRDVITGLLELIGDLDEQIAYEQNVPIANVPQELVVMWFHDSYHPEWPTFIEAFSAHELAVLAEFNDFYDARVDSLPADAGVADLQVTPQWAEISEKAATTHQALDS